MRHLCNILAIGCITLVVCACSGHHDMSKFAAVYHAGQAIKTATSLNVSYNKYQSLLQNFATEVNIANGSTKNDKEREMLSYYATALNHYKDAAKAWSTSLNLGDPDGNFAFLIKIDLKQANANACLANTIYQNIENGTGVESLQSCKGH